MHGTEESVDVADVVLGSCVACVGRLANAAAVWQEFIAPVGSTACCPMTSGWRKMLGMDFYGSYRTHKTYKKYNTYKTYLAYMTHETKTPHHSGTAHAVR
jgi:hypothetical protein